MREIGTVVLLLAFFLLPGSPSHAAVIVDTGTPTQLGFALNTQQSLGSEFTISQIYELTSIEGYLSTFPTPGTFTVALYTDGHEIPGAELFSGTANATAGDDWYGLTNLSFVLSPGTYWATFEVRPGNTFEGGMPDGSPNPLGNEAFTTMGNWIEFDALEIGVRILGEIAGVPEPSTLVLLLAGGIGLCARRRNR